VRQRERLQEDEDSDADRDDDPLPLEQAIDHQPDKGEEEELEYVEGGQGALIVDQEQRRHHQEERGEVLVRLRLRIDGGSAIVQGAWGIHPRGVEDQPPGRRIECREVLGERPVPAAARIHDRGLRKGGHEGYQVKGEEGYHDRGDDHLPV
jgi:hypothetical protein